MLSQRFAACTICAIYLGDVTDDNCGRCDNCRQDAGRIPRARRRRRSAAETTAAQSVPFSKGQRVQHKRFGRGEVLDSTLTHTTVDFPAAGVRRVLASYLRAATAN